MTNDHRFITCLTSSILKFASLRLKSILKCLCSRFEFNGLKLFENDVHD